MGCRFLQLFRNAAATHPEVLDLSDFVVLSFENWLQQLRSSPQDFPSDACASIESSQLDYILRPVCKLVNLLAENVRLGRGGHKQVSNRPAQSRLGDARSLIELKRDYRPPGDLLPGGPRHDNDFASQSDQLPLIIIH